MKEIILSGLAAGALVVLICSSKAGEKATDLFEKIVPKWIRPTYNYLVNCTFCTSWWVSLAMLGEFSVKEWAATVAVANIVVLLIHWSLSTTGEEDGLDQEMAGQPQTVAFHEGFSDDVGRAQRDARPTRVPEVPSSV
jgi:hypothetical protein